MSEEQLYLELDGLGLGATVRGFVPNQRLFDRFVLSRVLSWSNTGVVWLALDEHSQTEVALKFLPEVVRRDAVSFDDIKRTTVRSRELIHPHIVRIHDFVEDDYAAAISTEYVEGHSFATWRACQPTGVFEVDQIREWTSQLIDALEYAHGEIKVVHGDLKPGNLIVTETGALKIADFGTARSLSDSVHRVSMRDVPGEALVYMSPQQAMGGAPSTLDDIYSFGATLHEALAGKAPFSHDTWDLLAQIRDAPPPSITQRRSEWGIEGAAIPDEWEETIAACLAKEPAERPQTVVEVARRLGLRTDRTSTAITPMPTTTPPVDATPAPKPTPKRRSEMDWLIGMGLVMVLLDLGALGFYFGVVVPGEERDREARILQLEAATHSTVEEMKKIMADEASAQAKSDEENAALEKERQAADIRAAAAEQAAQAAKADAEKAQQAKQAAVKAMAAATAPVAGHPWTNGLGVKFVPAGTDGVLFSVWDVRVKDYAAFVTDTGRDWPKPHFAETDNDPAVEVSWDDANAFCVWLTKKEQTEGRLTSNQIYRLPTDAEWSTAVGLSENTWGTPKDKDRDIKDVYPWGTDWPPPKGSGNYAELLTSDGYAHTSPVGSFTANSYGLYDMGGDVWQWCQDEYDFAHEWRVLRGASWVDGDHESLFSSCRSGAGSGTRDDSSGFRVVLGVSP